MQSFTRAISHLSASIASPRAYYESLPLDDIDAVPPRLPSKSLPRRRWIHYLLYLVLGGIAGAIIGGCVTSFKALRPRYNSVTLYQNINSFPIVSTSKPESRAIVTSLYTDEYALSVATLGQTLTSHNITERRIVIYIPGRLSSRSLCIAAAAGWEPVPVPYIPPPHNGDGIFHHFADQFTKLNIWGLDKMGIDVLLYLDADTLVRNRFDELWDLPYSFAAVPDAYGDKESFTISINAGVLLIRPSSTVLEDMLSKLETASFPLHEAEQAFLNTYFAPKILRLPYIYNGNLAIKSASPSVWRAIKNELRIVHYTAVKPFWYLSDDVDINWNQNWKQSIRKSMEAEKGKFREELEWWSDAWDELMQHHFTTLDTCS